MKKLLLNISLVTAVLTLEFTCSAAAQAWPRDLARAQEIALIIINDFPQPPQFALSEQEMNNFRNRVAQAQTIEQIHEAVQNFRHRLATGPLAERVKWLEQHGEQQ